MFASKNRQLENPWPHRLAVLLVCATFPLIWVGGLVTTYDAGMAVPDWPTTYGYNLFLYPWQSWIGGPWDLFIEHGHRLLGAFAGLLTIGLLVAIFRVDRRLWMRFLAVATLGLVCAQGSLGGARVLLDDRQLAMIHGCIGPVFFALCTAMAVFTSRLWRATPEPQYHHAAASLYRLIGFTVLLVLIQLVLGAGLRHLPVWASHETFRSLVLFHLLVAGLVLVHVVLVAWKVLRHFRPHAALCRPALVLLMLVGLQVVLGAGTWVVKYGWPAWAPGSWGGAAYLVEAEGFRQAMTVTAHVATGSLILAVSVLLALRSLRLVRPQWSSARRAAPLKEGWAA